MLKFIYETVSSITIRWCWHEHITNCSRFTLYLISTYINSFILDISISFVYVNKCVPLAFEPFTKCQPSLYRKINPFRVSSAGESQSKVPMTCWSVMCYKMFVCNNFLIAYKLRYILITCHFKCSTHFFNLQTTNFAK